MNVHVAANRGPEEVFKVAMTGLDEIEAKRVLIENMLEALKQGKDIKTIASTYAKLGLTKELPTKADSGQQGK